MHKRFLALLFSVAILASTSVSGENFTARAVTNQDVITTFGGAETAVQGVPTAFNSRYTAIGNKVHAPFRSMGLDLNFTKPTMNYVVNASIDTCAINRNDFNSLCTHGSDSICSNDGPYHCSNAQYVSDTHFPKPREGSNIEVFLTVPPMCWVDSGHGRVLGLAGDGVAIVRDADAAKVGAGLGDTTNIYWVSKTMAHEIGHFWGAVDHYEVEFGDRRDNCIWGYNKDLPSVFQNLAFCTECHDTMYININDIEF